MSPNPPDNPADYTTNRDALSRETASGTSSPAGRSRADSVPDPSMLPYEQLGEFRLIRRLGRGGMAEVFLAEQTTLKREVALKVLRAELHANDVYRKRFEREAKAAAGLSHPNIVQVFAFGENEDVLYIAQEYVRGINLGEHLSRHGRIDLPLAMKIMRQVASALQAAAQAGIVHRDIKPGNIMLSEGNQIKVADFGLAHLPYNPDEANLTEYGTTMGTPTYMSPEQVRGEVLDTRSDIYSFGVTCYHMLAGEAPFRGETALNVAVQHLNNMPLSLAKLRSDLPRSLCNVVHRMLVKEPDQRYPDGNAIIADLKKIASALRRQANADSVVDTPPAGSPIQLRLMRFRSWKLARHATLLIPLALAVALLSGLLGWTWRPGNPLQTTSPAAPKVTHEPTAEAQFFLAQEIGDSEEAWRAVIEYYPESSLDVRRARERLVLLYIDRDRWDEVAAMADTLLEDRRADESSQAHAYTGRAVVANRQRDYHASSRIIQQDLVPLAPALSEPAREIVLGAIADNRRHIKGAIPSDLEEHFLDTGPGDFGDRP